MPRADAAIKKASEGGSNMGSAATRYVLGACLAGLLVSGAPARASTDWEIVPQDDARMPLGKMSVVGGVLGAEPLDFVLKNLTVSMPVQLTLAATDASRPVDLVVYRDSPAQPLAEGTATAEKPVTLRFKTGDSIYLEAKGADGAPYQLFAWVGPEFEIEDGSPVVPVSEYPAVPPRLERPTSTAPVAPPARDAKPDAASAAPVLGGTATVLLGVIAVALVAIVVLLWRRGSKRGAAALVFPVLLPLLARGEASAGDPGRITPKDEAKEIRRSVSDLSSILDKIIKGAEGSGFEGGTYKPTEREPGVIFVKDPSKDITYTIKTEREVDAKPGSLPKVKKLVGDSAALLKFTLGLLEEFGYIDPREAAVQRNPNPPGMPLLPSRCAKDPACQSCFRQATKALLEARDLLETQYVIYKQTEMAAGRILELGDAAAGMSSIAKFVWDQEKHGTAVSKAQEKLYATYDANLEKLLRNLNEALVAQGACERNAYGDQDWYNRYGWIYYSFMRDRYTRK
jgi:hypothetical protein